MHLHAIWKYTDETMLHGCLMDYWGHSAWAHKCTHPSWLYACMRAHIRPPSLLEFIFQGVLLTGKSCIQQALRNILSCASVVHHSDKVQWVSSEEEVTGIYTSSPVSFAFCLSAAAVRPSIFSFSRLHVSSLCTFTPFAICAWSLICYVGSRAVPLQFILSSSALQSIHTPFVFS